MLRTLLRGTTLHLGVIATAVLVMACQAAVPAAPPPAKTKYLPPPEQEAVYPASAPANFRIVEQRRYLLRYQWDAVASAEYYEVDLQNYNYPGKWFDFYGTPFRTEETRFGLDPGRYPAYTVIRARVRYCEGGECAEWTPWKLPQP
ncbi:MAG: hypothetical protein OXE53_13985 [Deltaproteobacteria bacterium]|nr:hypothetical protein [Deltaproteobacteria bacterium]